MDGQDSFGYRHGFYSAERITSEALSKPGLLPAFFPFYAVYRILQFLIFIHAWQVGPILQLEKKPTVKNDYLK